MVDSISPQRIIKPAGMANTKRPASGGEIEDGEIEDAAPASKKARVVFPIDFQFRAPMKTEISSPVPPSVGPRALERNDEFTKFGFSVPSTLPGG